MGIPVLHALRKSALMIAAIVASATLASANVMLDGLAKTAAANHAQTTAPMDKATAKMAFAFA